MTAVSADAMQGRKPPQDASSELRILLGVSFAVWFAVLAWDPIDRKTWLLENLMAAPFAIWLIATWPRVALSRTSYLWLFGFLAFHEIGSHYTYSQVPWPGGEGRNHYDRLIHLGFGVTFLRPVAELLLRAVQQANRRLALGLSVAVILALSTCYELLEWIAAVVTDPAQGLAFVGAQGDIWDARKDTALAGIGAVLMAAWLSYAPQWASFRRVALRRKDLT